MSPAYTFDGQEFRFIPTPTAGEQFIILVWIGGHTLAWISKETFNSETEANERTEAAITAMRRKNYEPYKNLFRRL